MLTRRMLVGLIVVLSSVAAHRPAVAGLDYQADDGSFEASVGENGGFRSLVLLQYEEQPGAEIIDSLTAVWGLHPGLAVDLLLYEDPDDDGDPRDAILLASVSATTSTFGVVESFPIPPTEISGSFFVGLDFPNAGTEARSFVAGDTGTTPARAWIALAGVGEPFDRDDLANNAPPVRFVSNFGIDFVPGLRATGSSVVFFGRNAYEFVPGAITFGDALAGAAERRFAGVTGHLVTITSDEENTFLANAFSGLAALAWIGASDEEESGAWRWIAGPEAGVHFWEGLAEGTPIRSRYNNWAPTEPNNLLFGETEDFAQIVLDPAGVFGGVPFATWLDSTRTGSNIQGGYIVEYELGAAFDFDDGTFQGWEPLRGDAGVQEWTVTDALNEVGVSSGSFRVLPWPWDPGRDSPHSTLLVRSPLFELRGTGPLTIDLTGGQGAGIEQAALPASPSELAADTETAGVHAMGIGLLDPATGQYLLTAQRPTNSEDFGLVTFTEEQLAPLYGGRYHLDVFDSFAGAWGWIGFDTVSVPGTVVPDGDADGLADVEDNCPAVRNPGQEDLDGNGIGDGCQCGDVNLDLITNVTDALRIARGEVLSGDPGFRRCDVNGDGECNVVDALEIARGEVTSSPGDQLCPAYLLGDAIDRFGVRIGDVDIDGQGSTATVPAGTPFTVNLGYTVWNIWDCPGCIAQIVLGIEEDGQDCAYDGIPPRYPGLATAAAVSLIAPGVPGTFEIRYRPALLFGCGDAVNAYDNAPPAGNVIGTLIVTEIP